MLTTYWIMRVAESPLIIIAVIKKYIYTIFEKKKSKGKLVGNFFSYVFLLNVGTFCYRSRILSVTH